MKYESSGVTIEGDTQLETFAREYNLSGDGTPENPIVISGFRFTFPFSANSGLIFKHTTLHVVITQCIFECKSPDTIVGAQSHYAYLFSHVYMYNCQNITIKDNIFICNNWFVVGVVIEICDNIIIMNNLFDGQNVAQCGVHGDGSGTLLICNNITYGFQYALDILMTRRVVIAHNIAINCNVFVREFGLRQFESAYHSAWRLIKNISHYAENSRYIVKCIF